MRILFVISFIAVCLSQSSAQQHLLSLNGGYVFTTIKERSDNASGFRTGVLFEILPKAGNVLHGVNVTYMNVIANVVEESNGQPIDYKYSITTWPIYYTPKFLIGRKTLQGFIKPAIGMQFSNLKLTSPTDVFTSTDAGLYGGLGVGAMKKFNGNLIVTLEYEWAYLSNSYFNDGFAHSFMLGVGKFID